MWPSFPPGFDKKYGSTDPKISGGEARPSNPMCPSGALLSPKVEQEEVLLGGGCRKLILGGAAEAVVSGGVGKGGSLIAEGSKDKGKEKVIAEGSKDYKGKEKVPEDTGGVVGIQRRKVGRPKGAKNKPKVGAMEGEGGAVLDRSRRVSLKIRGVGKGLKRNGDDELLEAIGNEKVAFLLDDSRNEEDPITYGFYEKSAGVFCGTTSDGNKKMVLLEGVSGGNISFDEDCALNQGRPGQSEMLSATQLSERMKMVPAVHNQNVQVVPAVHNQNVKRPRGSPVNNECTLACMGENIRPNGSAEATRLPVIGVPARCPFWLCYCHCRNCWYYKVGGYRNILYW